MTDIQLAQDQGTADCSLCNQMVAAKKITAWQWLCGAAQPLPMGTFKIGLDKRMHSHHTQQSSPLLLLSKFQTR
jgi:hypothetical protein